MARSICSQYAQPEVCMFDIGSAFGAVLLESLDVTEHGTYLAPDPKVYRAVISSLVNESERMASGGLQPIVARIEQPASSFQKADRESYATGSGPFIR